MDHVKYLRECLNLARESVSVGSSPVGAVLVNAAGEIVARGRNRTGERQSEAHVGHASVAHAEMDLFFQTGQPENPQDYTLYTSLEPCLMCGGASAMLQIGRLVWATDDPWGGSGRLIAWNEHPAMREVEVLPCPDPDLEREGAELFAAEAKKAYPDEGWQKWQARYPRETSAVEST